MYQVIFSIDINTRDNIRQRGGQLLVTRVHPFLQLMFLAGALNAQLSIAAHALLFLPPL
jgi:hypothetical protein